MNGVVQSPAQPVANDIFVDGFLAHTFSPHDVQSFLPQLLRTPHFLQYYNVMYSGGAWYITQNAPYVLPQSPGLPAQHPPMPLDFNVGATEGTVVPQRRWIPTDEVDVRRHIEEASLQLPIFFINRNGGIGFTLHDILQGRDIDLFNRDTQAPLGGVSTTHIRMNWPGYLHWKRQVAAKDETFRRAPITIGRFMKHLASSVDKFFNHCMTPSVASTDPRWLIAPNGITQNHVKIIGAVHISAGSWMPIVQLTRYVIPIHTSYLSH